jgi:hypothetical protein
MARAQLSLLKSISIADLLLDEENPRLEEGHSQPEILALWSKDRRNVRLAADVAEHGLSPLEPFAVIHHPSLSKRFIVLDGNRRTAVLKLLAQPNLAADERAAQKFRQLANRHAATLLRQAPSMIFASREAADPWIDRRHSGENKGVGGVTWGTIQKYRRNARRGTPDPNQEAMQVLALAKDNGWISEEQRRAIRVTTLRRVLSTARDQIGLSLTPDGPKVLRPPAEATRVMSTILGALAKKGVVRELDQRDQREEFVRKHLRAVNAGPVMADQGGGTSVTTSTGSQTARAAAQTRPRTRRTLAPPVLTFSVNHLRCAAILGELQLIKVQDTPNAAVVLFRVFVELSADHFLTTKGATLERNTSLHAKIRDCISRLSTTQYALTKAQQQVMAKVLGNEHHPLHPNTLNAFVHNPEFFPLESDLPKMWDQIEAYIKSLWKELE